ncbi:MAG: pilus assembly protein PilP [Pseudomonadota bacterium]
MNDPDLANTGSWSLPLRLIVILTACLLLTGIVYITLLQTQQQQLKQIQSSHDHLRSSFEQQRLKTTRLPQQQTRYAALRHALDRQVQPDMAPDTTADLLVAVSQIGLSTNVNFATFQPQASTTRELHVETPITLSVTGQYHNLATFISTLVQHPGIMTLHDMVLQRTTPASKKNPLLSLTFTLKAHHTTPWKAPTTGQPQPVESSLPVVSPIIYAAAGRRNPFTPPQNKSAAPAKRSSPHLLSALQQHAADTLQMVGTVSQQQQHWGLLQSPDGQIHRVKIGSYVGRNQGRVQSIHPDRIIVREHQNADGKTHQIVLRQTTLPTNNTRPVP